MWYLIMDSQLIAERYNEIESLRASGRSWKDIASSLFGDDSDKGSKILATYFARESRKLGNPDLVAISEWIKSRRKEITTLLEVEKRPWVYIGRALDCPVPLNSSKSLKMVAGEYYRVSSGSPKRVKEPTQPQAKATPPVPAPALDVSAVQSTSVAIGQKAATTAVANTSGVNPDPQR